MQRVSAAAVVIASAVVLSLATFFGAAAAVVWLVESFEGEISECHRGRCGAFGELLDDHDLLAVIVLGVVAAVPGIALLWAARRRLSGSFAKPR